MNATVKKLKKFLADLGLERKALMEPEVKGLLRELNVPVPAGVFVPAGGALPSPLRLSFPLAAKIASPTIASKTDVGGVRLEIRDVTELTEVVSQLQKIPGVAGVIVEEMALPCVEVIVGGVVDPQFGPIVMFGIGGIFVELFRDVTFALAPLDEADALRLISETKGSRVLHGYRGKPAVDVNALAAVMVTVSEIMGSGLVEEIDLNPVILYPEGAVVVDAKLKML